MTRPSFHGIGDSGQISTLRGVTTSRRASEAERRKAQAIAQRLRVPFEERTGPLQPENGPVLVVEKDRLVIASAGGPLFFHPGMAKPRIRAWQQGRTDVMAEAMGLGPGMSVLDGTLGLGADAIVASYIVGPTGRIVGLEAVPALAEVVAHGLACYEFGHEDIVQAMRRIHVVPADHDEFLRKQPDNAFDVVYFDPLFQRPVEETVHMRPWRELGHRAALQKTTLVEARRVARRRVVVKERRGSGVFAQLGIERIAGGKGSRVAYGVLEATR